jgi:hypothetical protein
MLRFPDLTEMQLYGHPVVGLVLSGAAKDRSDVIVGDRAMIMKTSRTVETYGTARPAIASLSRRLESLKLGASAISIVC